MTDLEVGSIVYRKFYSRTDKVRILELSEKHHTDSSMYYRDMKVKICGTEKIRQYRIPFYIENNNNNQQVYKKKRREWYLSSWCVLYLSLQEEDQIYGQADSRLCKQLFCPCCPSGYP